MEDETLLLLIQAISVRDIDSLREILNQQSESSDALKDYMKVYSVINAPFITGLKDNKCCPICLEEYKPREHYKLLGCNHGFHRKCIRVWLKKNLTCPVCRKDVLH